MAATVVAVVFVVAARAVVAFAESAADGVVLSAADAPRSHYSASISDVPDLAVVEVFGVPGLASAGVSAAAVDTSGRPWHFRYSPDWGDSSVGDPWDDKHRWGAGRAHFALGQLPVRDPVHHYLQDGCCPEHSLGWRADGMGLLLPGRGQLRRHGKLRVLQSLQPAACPDSLRRAVRDYCGPPEHVEPEGLAVKCDAHALLLLVAVSV